MRRLLGVEAEGGKERLPLFKLVRTRYEAEGHRRFRRLRILLLLTVLPGVALLAWSQGGKSRAQQADPSALLRKAEEALNRHDYAAALDSLKRVVEIDPKSTAAWFNLAYAYSGLHQNDDAVRAYQRTLELDPNLFEARLNLGIMLVEMKKPQASLEHLQKTVKLKPEHARAHLYYGRALNLAGQAEAAEKQFQEALRLDPGLAIAQFDLGQVYLSAKRYAEARTAFQKSWELDPKLPQAQLGMALASEGLNDLAAAVTHFEQYLAAKPDDLETRFHLARILVQQAKNELALENLQTLYRAKPDLPGLAAALGDVHALRKNYPESEKFYRQALAVSPGEGDLHRALARTLLDEKKLSEAEAEFRASLKLDPHNGDAAKGLATSVYLEERYPEAILLFEAQARAPDAPAGVFFVLATCYDHLRVLPKAIEAYQRFLELSRGESPDQEWQARQRLKLLRRETQK